MHIGPHNVARAERGVALERTATARAVEDRNQEFKSGPCRRPVEHGPTVKNDSVWAGVGLVAIGFFSPLFCLGNMGE